jgi:hypothetical protein
VPDPERLGGLAWTRRTKGSLSSRERRRLLGAIVRGQAEYIAGRIRLATGRVPAGARDLALADFQPPDSAYARAAEEACAEQLPAVAGHGYRTWALGSGLAALDGHALEPELFYVACLLHDWGICEPVAGEDFTIRSAERAARAAEGLDVAPEDTEAIGDAITVHATPGATVEVDGALGCYVQAGAVFDLAGVRAGDLPRSFREETVRAHPRAGVTDEIVRLIGAEARAVPEGRFALLRRCGFVPLIRLAPLRPR